MTVWLLRDAGYKGKLHCGTESAVLQHLPIWPLNPWPSLVSLFRLLLIDQGLPQCTSKPIQTGDAYPDVFVYVVPKQLKSLVLGKYGAARLKLVQLLKNPTKWKVCKKETEGGCLSLHKVYLIVAMERIHLRIRKTIQPPSPAQASQDGPGHLRQGVDLLHIHVAVARISLLHAEGWP